MWSLKVSSGSPGGDTLLNVALPHWRSPHSCHCHHSPWLKEVSGRGCRQAIQGQWVEEVVTNAWKEERHWIHWMLHIAMWWCMYMRANACYVCMVPNITVRICLWLVAFLESLLHQMPQAVDLIRWKKNANSSWTVSDRLFKALPKMNNLSCISWASGQLPRNQLPAQVENGWKWCLLIINATICSTSMVSMCNHS